MALYQNSQVRFQDGLCLEQDSIATSNKQVGPTPLQQDDDTEKIMKNKAGQDTIKKNLLPSKSSVRERVFGTS